MEESKDVIATSREADEKAVGSQDNENGSGAQLLDPEARPLCFKSTFEEILFVLTATMAIGMGSILTGSITVITSFVGDDLGMTTAEITWISSASSYVVCALPAYDIFANYVPVSRAALSSCSLARLLISSVARC